MDKKDIIDFKYNFIRQINKYRNSHGVKSLRSDKELDNYAQKIIDYLFSGGQYNNQNPDETIYQSRNYLSPNNLAKILYDENKNYNFNGTNQWPSNFTKMVWKNAGLIGFAMQKDSYNNYYFVIKYHPIENNGDFNNNVFPFGTKYSDTFNKNKTKDNYLNRNQPYQQYNQGQPSQEEEKPFNYDQFCLEALNAHNYYRRIHHAYPLTINNQLSNIAQNYSRRLAYTIRALQHSTNRYNNENLGENLYYCTGKVPTGNMATKSWYDEIEYYNFNSDSGNTASGHFSQVVWKGTREVGFGVTKNYNGQYFVVANYFPAGNTLGAYRENVLRP